MDCDDGLGGTFGARGAQIGQTTSQAGALHRTADAGSFIFGGVMWSLQTAREKTHTQPTDSNECGNNLTGDDIP